MPAKGPDPSPERTFKGAFLRLGPAIPFATWGAACLASHLGGVPSGKALRAVALCGILAQLVALPLCVMRLLAVPRFSAGFWLSLLGIAACLFAGYLFGTLLLVGLAIG